MQFSVEKKRELIVAGRLAKRWHKIGQTKNTYNINLLYPNTKR